MAAASMATTSSVPKAILFPSNDAVTLKPKISSSSLKFQYKPMAGRIHGKVGMSGKGRSMQVVAMSSPTPAEEKIASVVEEKIKEAKKVCEGDNTSGECAASWDEIEELSATISDMRTKQKSTDPLETFCKDNPETDECRIYDD